MSSEKYGFKATPSNIAKINLVHIVGASNENEIIKKKSKVWISGVQEFSFLLFLITDKMTDSDNFFFVLNNFPTITSL